MTWPSSASEASTTSRRAASSTLPTRKVTSAAWPGPTVARRRWPMNEKSTAVSVGHPPASSLARTRTASPAAANPRSAVTTSPRAGSARWSITMVRTCGRPRTMARSSALATVRSVTKLPSASLSIVVLGVGGSASWSCTVTDSRASGASWPSTQPRTWPRRCNTSPSRNTGRPGSRYTRTSQASRRAWEASAQAQAAPRWATKRRVAAAEAPTWASPRASVTTGAASSPAVTATPARGAPSAVATAAVSRWSPRRTTSVRSLTDTSALAA